jgi:hypothetical protein
MTVARFLCPSRGFQDLRDTHGQNDTHESLVRSGDCMLGLECLLGTGSPDDLCSDVQRQVGVTRNAIDPIVGVDAVTMRRSRASGKPRAPWISFSGTGATTADQPGGRGNRTRCAWLDGPVLAPPGPQSLRGAPGCSKEGHQKCILGKSRLQIAPIAERGSSLR